MNESPPDTEWCPFVPGRLRRRHISNLRFDRIQSAVRAATTDMLHSTTLMLVLFTGQAEATDQPGAPTDDANSGWIGIHLLGAAADYTVSVKQDEEFVELGLEEPLLRFADPITNVADGYLLVWTQNGRPDACASFWVHRLPDRLRELHEFQSLSEHSILARYEDTDVWQPELAGVEWHSITDAPPPDSTKHCASHRCGNWRGSFPQRSGIAPDAGNCD